MDRQIELKRLIVDFNEVVKRINKAESLTIQELKGYSDKKFDRLSKILIDLLKQSSQLANRIEQYLGRPLTSYESLNGINI